MEFFKTQTGSYLGINKEDLYQVHFGKRTEDGTFYFSQESFPPEMLETLLTIYANSPLTPVDWENSPVTQSEIEAVLNQIKILGTQIN